jgi:hypothetical protein
VSVYNLPGTAGIFGLRRFHCFRARRDAPEVSGGGR